MKEFWNTRYAEEEFAYGTEPNEFYRQEIQKLQPGKILFPAEGEGRNAVYSAILGWDAVAFDQSESAKIKAEKLAADRGVQIRYQVADLKNFEAKSESFDALVLIFAHFPAALRKEFHQNLIGYLKPGGTLILEGFSKSHIQFNSVNEKAGGPKDVSMLFSKEEMEADFADLTEIHVTELETELEEGRYHVGKSAVIRVVGKK